LKEVIELGNQSMFEELEVKKIKTALELLDDIFFEYDTCTKFICIYVFKDGEKLVLKNDLLENWKNDCINNKNVFEEDVPLFEKLCFDIEQGCSDFFYKIRMKLLSEDKLMEYIAIKGKSVNLKSNVIKVGTFSKGKLFCSLQAVQQRDNDESLDFLTQVYSRQSILSYAKNKINQNKVISLIVIDIDYFKQVNDTYGHMFGDLVLTMISSVVKQIVGDKGRVGRMGGDEFIIILDDISQEADLKPILKKVREEIESIYFGKPDFKVSVSMGAAAFVDDVSSYDELFQVADKALYIAKEKGRNCYVIYSFKRHGSLKEFLSDEADFLTNIKKTDSKKCENINFVVKKVFNEGINSLSEVLESLKESYSLESLGIFIEDFQKPKYYIGDLEVLDKYMNCPNGNRLEYQVIQEMVCEKHKYDARFFKCDNRAYSVLYEYLDSKEDMGGAVIAISQDKIKVSRNDERFFSIIATLLGQIIK